MPSRTLISQNRRRGHTSWPRRSYLPECASISQSRGRCHVLACVELVTRQRSASRIDAPRSPHHPLREIRAVKSVKSREIHGANLMSYTKIHSRREIREITGNSRREFPVVTASILPVTRGREETTRAGQ